MNHRKPGSRSWGLGFGTLLSAALDISYSCHSELECVLWSCWNNLSFAKVELSGVSFVHIKVLVVTSLVVLWLRIHLPVQGTQVRSLVWEDPTCHRATKPVHHSCWACAPQLLKPTLSRVHVLQLLSLHAANTEAHAPRACAPQQEKPWQWEACVPQRKVAPAHRTRESPHEAMETRCSQKINKN